MHLFEQLFTYRQIWRCEDCRLFERQVVGMAKLNGKEHLLHDIHHPLPLRVTTGYYTQGESGNHTNKFKTNTRNLVQGINPKLK